MPAPKTASEALSWRPTDEDVRVAARIVCKLTDCRKQAGSIESDHAGQAQEVLALLSPIVERQREEAYYEGVDAGADQALGMRTD